MGQEKDFTIEELKRMYDTAAEEYKTIGEMLRQKEREEADRKKAQLALEKEKRKKEVDDALENCHALLDAYVKDYGTYKIQDKFEFPWWWF